MKIKLLLPPLLIVMCIAIMVWFVYPAYTNGSDGIKEKRQTLAGEKKKMSEAQEKSNNVSLLMAQLENNKVDRDTILTFVPDNPGEEEIIDNLNFIATNEGLSVINLSIKSAPAASPTEIGTSEAGVPITDINPVQASIVKPKEYNVDFSVVGNYEKIKNVFEKIYKLGRFNAAESLNIEQQGTQTGSDKKSVSEDNLVVIAQLKFNALKKSSQTISINNPAFAEKSFNLETAQAIRNKKSVEVLKMNIDQAGRSNPFLP
jgi:Tfp pilus assembly protein PilO